MRKRHVKRLWPLLFLLMTDKVAVNVLADIMINVGVTFVTPLTLTIDFSQRTWFSVCPFRVLTTYSFNFYTKITLRYVWKYRKLKHWVWLLWTVYVIKIDRRYMWNKTFIFMQRFFCFTCDRSLTLILLNSRILRDCLTTCYKRERNEHTVPTYYR